MNEVGRHEEALAVCRDALAHAGALARAYPMAYEHLEREGALATAGAGRADEAARWLDELLELHADDEHPLLIGLLHRDRARIAQMESDEIQFDRHSTAARAQFERTENPALLNQGRRLAQMTTSSDAPPSTPVPTQLEDGAGLLRSVIGAPLGVLARRALEHVVGLTGASRAYLYMLHEGVGSLTARLGDDGAPPPLEGKIQEFMAAYDHSSDATETCSIHETCTDLLMMPLIVVRGERTRPVGVIAAFGCQTPDALTPEHLTEIAVALQSSTTTVVEGNARGAGGRTGERA
jgi:hypothetical protein